MDEEKNIQQLIVDGPQLARLLDAVECHINSRNPVQAVEEAARVCEEAIAFYKMVMQQIPGYNPGPSMN